VNKPEHIERRIVGAIRWIDAISLAPIALPLAASSDELRFQRNLSGLTVVTHADGLTTYENTFDLEDLATADEVDLGSLELEGEVVDPSGTYLPRKFTLALPRDPSPELDDNNQRPANTLFTPFNIELLPSPTARVPAGWAQVRVLIENADGDPIPNAIARVVTDDVAAKVLGIGQADSRGETLVAIAGLRHFAPGETEDEVVSIETQARLEIIMPPPDENTVDWTELKDAAVADGDTDPEVLQLKPGGIYSRRYPFTT
jgi:hypothetical protein